MPVELNAVIEISDAEMKKLAKAIAESASEDDRSDRFSVNAADLKITGGGERVDLPESWELVEEQHGVTYTWPEPEGPDIYDPFRIYEGHTAAGVIRLAIGECERTMVRDEERKYLIAGHISPSGSFRPVAEFLATDDHSETGDTIAVIKGKEGTAKMYDPADDLPSAYDGFEVQTYRERVDKPRSYFKLGIVANEEDPETMLAHTLIQAQTRLGIRPR